MILLDGALLTADALKEKPKGTTLRLAAAAPETIGELRVHHRRRERHCRRTEHRLGTNRII